MNVAQMMNRRNENQSGMSLQSVQSDFRNLSKNQIKEAVELARRQGMSEIQINEGLRMIESLKNIC